MASEGKKLVKVNGDLRMLPVSDALSSPFTLREPVWIPDAQCSTCVQCQGKFDFLNRRHHCRRCGKCFCDRCSSSKVHLPRMLYVDPVRHCAGCSTISSREKEFFEKHVKNLMNGASFTVKLTDNSTDDTVFVCKLTQDHRQLQFENESAKLDSILVGDIDSVQIWVEEKDSDGNPLASGLAMRYKDSCGEQQLVKLQVVSDSQQRRKGQAWIASMQKAFKMVCDTRMA